jgi:hypothetical protein
VTLLGTGAAAREYLDAKSVLVYTMGKVGSSSVERALPSAIHTHTLYGFPPCEEYHLQKYGRVGFALRRALTYPAKRAVLRRRGRIDIVTFYRDPRHRNPSMFMQDLPFWLTKFLRGKTAVARNPSATLLLDAYRAVFPHDYPLQWVRRELGRFTSVSTPDLSLGSDDFRITEAGKLRVFIGRAERIDQCAAPLGEFLGLDTPMQVGRVNEGRNKWYSPLYETFLSQLERESDIPYSPKFRELNGYGDRA